jgi:DNA repair exonuclease SbcCD ATPase subunit
MWQDKYQKTEEDFRRYEENERTLINEYQAKITQINQQRLAELNAKVSELNQCKFDLANKINEINQIKTEISIKSTEIIRLKEDTTAQSNIFEFSRKEYDDKLRERMDMINDLKNRLVNCEKMIDQNRRERDMLLQ